MKRFVEGLDRGQSTLFPETLEDFVAEDNAVRVIEAFVQGLDLGGLGFGGVDPKATGRPSYHPSVLLKLYIYGYLNRVQSSRRLEREAARNVEANPARNRRTGQQDIYIIQCWSFFGTEKAPPMLAPLPGACPVVIIWGQLCIQHVHYGQCDPG